jgi:hypothetical protein
MSLKQWLNSKINGPVYVDCYTRNPAMLAASKIKPALKYTPSWWKRLPPKPDVEIFKNIPGGTIPGATLRHCPGFVDFFKNSFCVPMWSDFQIYVAPEGQEGFECQFSDKDCKFVTHPAYQKGDFMPPDKYQHIQLLSPWYFACDEDINFLLIDPFWHDGDNPDRLSVAPGMVNFKYQHMLNYNLFIRKVKDMTKGVLIEYDTPVMFIVPLTDRKVIFRYHFLKDEDKAVLAYPRVSFNRSYEKFRNMVRREGAGDE